MKWRPVSRAGAALLALAALPSLAGCQRAAEAPGDLTGRAEATASLDRAELAFGDDVTLTVEVRADPALEVELPHAGELEGFRILDSGTARADSGGVRVERRWTRLRAERAGPQTLPALEVRYRPAPMAVETAAAKGSSAPWATVSTQPLTVEVRSLLPPGDQPAEIRDIKPLQPVDRPRPWLSIAGIVAVVLASAAGLAYWLRRRRRVEQSAPAAPPIPPHEIALAALDGLAASEPVGAAAERRFHFALSEIVRAYVEGRFGLNATDLTTEEILGALHRLPLGEEGLAVGLRAFLVDTDRVKFASHRPRREEIGAILEWARDFVEATRPRLSEDLSGTVNASSREAA